MEVEKVTIGPTNGSGAATGRSGPLTGRILGIWIDNGDLDNTTDLTITEEQRGSAILTVTNLAADGWYAPRIPIYGTDGTALLHAAGGTPELAPIPIDGQVKIVAAQGGSGHTGYAYIFVE